MTATKPTEKVEGQEIKRYTTCGKEDGMNDKANIDWGREPDLVNADYRFMWAIARLNELKYSQEVWDEERAALRAELRPDDQMKFDEYAGIGVPEPVKSSLFSWIRGARAFGRTLAMRAGIYEARRDEASRADVVIYELASLFKDVEDAWKRLRLHDPVDMRRMENTVHDLHLRVEKILHSRKVDTSPSSFSCRAVKE